MTTKRKGFLWSVSLTLTIVICITIVYISISRTRIVENQKFSSRIVKQNSLHSEKLTDENCIPTCGTKECIMHAKSLLSRIDSTVDPCDNAHSFLCGEFLKNAHESQNVKDQIAEKLWIEVKNILDNLQAEPGSSSEKLKIVYDSCMDYGSSELQGALPFQKFLENDLGIANWPYLDPNFEFADSGIFKLLGIAKSFEEFSVFSIFTWNNAENFTHSVHFRGYMNINEITIKSEGAVHALEYFDLSEEEMESIVSDIENVEKSIVDLYISSKQTICEGECTYTYVNCSNLNVEEWTLLCKTVEAYVVTKYGAKERKDAIVIEVRDQVIVKNFLLLMDSLTDKSVVNYFAFRFLWKLSEEINFYFRLTKMKYDNGLYASNKVQPLMWKHCIKWIRRNMKLSLTKELFRHYLRPPVTEQISDFFNTSISDLNRIIELQEWIPPERKADVINKVGTVTLNIMDIKDILESSMWFDLTENYIGKFDPTRESFFNNVLQYMKINVATPLVIKSTLFATGGQLAGGIIHMNYGLFVPPYYTPNLNREINRLSNALIVGHEIGHVIYYELARPILNDTEYIPEFLKAKKCIENQFSQFKFGILKENLNGSQYYSENLADSIAATLIDKILDEYESAEQMQFLLPGLAYSTNQFLYMSALQSFCSKENLKSEIRFKEIDRHAPPKFRIIGPAQNSRSYSRLFQCSVGSYMNPAKKCSLFSNS